MPWSVSRHWPLWRRRNSPEYMLASPIFERWYATLPSDSPCRTSTSSRIRLPETAVRTTDAASHGVSPATAEELRDTRACASCARRCASSRACTQGFGVRDTHLKTAWHRHGRLPAVFELRRVAPACRATHTATSLVGGAMEYIEYHAHMVEQWGARGARHEGHGSRQDARFGHDRARREARSSSRRGEAKRVAAAAARARADAEAPKAEARGCSRARPRRKKRKREAGADAGAAGNAAAAASRTLSLDDAAARATATGPAPAAVRTSAAPPAAAAAAAARDPPRAKPRGPAPKRAPTRLAPPRSTTTRATHPTTANLASWRAG